MRDRTLIALAALVALGAGLRFSTLGLQSYWYDEAVTVGIVRMDFGGMVSAVYHHESTPPLYYVLAWLWCKLFGTGEVGLRSLSALFGTASIPVFYAAARELVSREVGLAVAVLAAVNPLLVWYSQEGRAYALLALLGGLSLLSFARVLKGGGGRALVWWALFSGLALLTHYFAVFLVAPEAAWLVWRRRERAVAAAVAGVVAVAVAVLPVALHQQSLDLASFIRGAPLGFRLARVPKQYLVGFDAPLEVAAAVVTAVIAAAGVVLAFARLRDRLGVRVAGILVLAGVGLPFLLALLGSDYFETRNLLALWLPFAIAVAAGLVLVGGRWGLAGVGVLCALGLAAVVAVDVVPNWRRNDWRGAAKALGDTSEPRAIVVTPANGALPLGLYLKRLRPLRATGTSLDLAALVSTGKRSTGTVHPPRPPRPRNPQIPRFTRVRSVYADSYTVVTFRGGGVGVTPPGLANYRLLKGAGAAVLLQEPER